MLNCSVATYVLFISKLVSNSSYGMCSLLVFDYIAIHVLCNVPLSHLRSKGKASAYILYCTGSGMLTRYTHCGQCNIFYIALTTVHISS